MQLIHNSIGLKDVVRLTQAISDCVDPAEFQSHALPQIAAAMGCKSAVVLIKQPKTGVITKVGADYNFSAHFATKYIGEYRGLDPVQAMIERNLTVASSTTVSTDSSVARDFENTPYYQEMLRPLGIHRYLCSAWRSSNEMLVQYGVHRPRPTAEFTADEHMLSLALMPAVARIFERDLNKAREGLLRSLCATLCDALHLRSALVLNDLGCIVYADPRATDLLNLGAADRSGVCGAVRRFTKRVLPEVHRSAPRSVRVKLLLQSRSFPNGVVRILPHLETPLYLLTLEQSRGGPARLSCHLGLSPRAAEIADLIVAGCSNAEIAGKLHLSVNTVRNHISHVYDHLCVHSRVELVRLVTGL
jgi:DNA-binding CsgD family transcriptional regulator